MPHAVKTITHALDEARALMADWVVPEGASDADTLGELVGVLDNRTLNQAMRTLSGPFHQGINRKLLAPRYKVAFDLLHKYGVMVDPSSLSDEVIERLYPRVNYPRFSYGQTLRDWSDAVLGEGEQVQFFLPQAPRRNTHLATVQLLSDDLRELSDAMVKAVCPAGEAEAEPAAQDTPYEPEVRQAPPSDFAAEAQVITSGARRGINTLIALGEEAEERWTPAMRECIGAVLKSHQQDSEADTLEVMVELVDRLDKLAREARKIIDERDAAAN
ncbi:hypothetical protein [Pseudomonas sp.]|uniref:hypothetical protein n=1 Tax=Pseudomonas sp. TaxID=306 RepID=UPI0028AC0C4F|nr:hypothetical protein [Pseudomonas sp.]